MQTADTEGKRDAAGRYDRDAAQAAAVTDEGMAQVRQADGPRPPEDASPDALPEPAAPAVQGAALGWMLGQPATDASPPARRPERLLRPADYVVEPVEPPQTGWQRPMFRLGVRVRPSKRESMRRTHRERARRPLASAKVIVVFSPKGGVGKSTTTIQLGHALVTVRGDPAVALDANPDAGNLVKKVPEPYSLFSVNQLCHDMSRVRQRSDLLPYLTAGETGLCVVRSDAKAWERPSPAEYLRVIGTLTKYFALVIVDLGTGIREPAFLSMMDLADAAVVVAQPTSDCGEVLAESLDFLRLWYPAKIGAGTLVINAIKPKQNAAAADRLAAELSHQVMRICRVPRDPHLASGGVPRWLALASDTRDAYLELAATVLDSLPDEASPAGQ